MKKVILLITTTIVLISCGAKKGTETPATDSTKTTMQYFGDTITEDKAVNSNELMNVMASSDSSNVKFTTTIKEVCQKKGCWMDVDMGNGKLMTVKFKDYGFFVPKDAAGKTAVMEGWCFKEIQTVDWLKHKAEDAGKSKEEIDAITQSDTSFTFLASGVIIK